MATVASGSNVQWYYCIEDGSGDISATTPNFVPIRFNSTDLSRETAQIDSDEINPSRQRDKSRQGTYSLAGSIVANLAYGEHDYLMQAALQSTWQSQATITAGTIAAVAASNEFTDSGNGFVAAGFKVGDLVTVTGFTGDVANNLVDGEITSLAAGSMIIGGTDGDVIADDAAGETVTIQTVGTYLEVGSTVPTIALLKRNSDVSVDTLYRHNRIGGMSIGVSLNSAATITVPVIGESAETYTVPGGSTFSAQTTTGMMVPTTGYMQDNKSALAYLTEYSLELSNNMNPLFALFQRGAYSVENGVLTVSGSMSAYLPDATLATKFIDETATDHLVKLMDNDGNYYRFYLPDVIYTQLSDPVAGQGAQINSYTFSAGYDSNAATTIRIEKS